MRVKCRLSRESIMAGRRSRHHGSTDHEDRAEILSNILTKAFLNCNELPKSELCLVQVPSGPLRTPYIHPLASTPRHEYIYIDRQTRHFSFASPSVTDGVAHPRYFIYRRVAVVPTVSESRNLSRHLVLFA